MPKSVDSGEFYAEYDEDTGLWCVFRDGDDPDFAYSSWGDQEMAEMDASERNLNGDE